ncbi:MAG: HAMP domain-containing histidine kinase [Pseudobdellovibrionaceae bacterium]|nr:MAG: HAMP domain-containing histidine kinase [Pseudobdellovibrionaceae bacterium]
MFKVNLDSFDKLEITLPFEQMGTTSFTIGREVPDPFGHIVSEHRVFFNGLELATIHAAVSTQNFHGLLLSKYSLTYLLLFIIFIFFSFSLQAMPLFSLIRFNDWFNKKLDHFCPESPKTNLLIAEIRGLEKNGSIVNDTKIKFLKKLLEIIRLETKIAESKTQAQIARRLAHDIRSPLSAINVVGQSLPENFKGRELLIEASSRINEISNDILDKSRSSIETAASVVADLSMIVASIQKIINEKTAAYPNLNIDFSVENVASGLSQTKKIIPSEFERALSNLLQNSIEATEECVSPRVWMSLKTRDNRVELKIEDNGPGIPDEIRLTNGSRPVTMGKSNGNGLGLISAFDFAKKHDGKLEILNPAVGAGLLLVF